MPTQQLTVASLPLPRNNPYLHLPNEIEHYLNTLLQEPDFKVLGQQYYTQDDKVLIRDRVMNEAELTAFEMQLKVASGSII